MLKTRKTDNTRVPEEGRASIGCKADGTWYTVDDQGVETVLGGGGGGGDNLIEDPPLTAGWYGATAVERSGISKNVWGEKDLTGVVPAGTKWVEGIMGITTSGETAHGTITVHYRPGNIEDGVDPTGLQIVDMAPNAERNVNTVWHPVTIILPGSGPDDLKFDLKMNTSEVAVSSMMYQIKVFKYG